MSSLDEQCPHQDGRVVIDPAFKADAPARYAESRKRGPIPLGLKGWVIVGHDLAREALTHPARLKDATPAAGHVLHKPAVGLGTQMPAADPPDPTRPSPPGCTDWPPPRSPHAVRPNWRRVSSRPGRGVQLPAARHGRRGPPRHPRGGPARLPPLVRAGTPGGLARTPPGTGRSARTADRPQTGNDGPRAGDNAPRAGGDGPAVLDVPRPDDRPRVPLARVPELELAIPADSLEWIGSGIIRGVVSLPVRYRVGTGPGVGPGA
ncbi:hypothetical protein [Streptomyces sp. SID13726]|uniref:hypothetical protein n=1 Tax=Streptomyces sp. SID13726 TaxID=2706058 RepID=UPI001EF30D82|nr:hypothetical protein [Streptomyces sp. SID13726]